MACYRICRLSGSVLSAHVCSCHFWLQFHHQAVHWVQERIVPNPHPVCGHVCDLPRVHFKTVFAAVLHAGVFFVLFPFLSRVSMAAGFACLVFVAVSGACSIGPKTAIVHQISAGPSQVIAMPFYNRYAWCLTACVTLLQGPASSACVNHDVFAIWHGCCLLLHSCSALYDVACLCVCACSIVVLGGFAGPYITVSAVSCSVLICRASLQRHSQHVLPLEQRKQHFDVPGGCAAMPNHATWCLADSQDSSCLLLPPLCSSCHLAGSGRPADRQLCRNQRPVWHLPYCFWCQFDCHEVRCTVAA